MRNAIVALVLLILAFGAWMYLQEEPDWVAAETVEPMPGAAAPDTNDPTATVAERIPNEADEDAAYEALRAERDERLAEIREEAEQRAREASEESRRGDPPRGSGLSGGGGGGGGGGEVSAEEQIVAPQDEPEPEPEETVDPTSLVALETEAARLAQEIDLVPESRLEGLSDAEQRTLLADEWVWHTFLIEKFGPDYTISQQNQANVAREPFNNATADERQRRLQDAI